MVDLGQFLDFEKIRFSGDTFSFATSKRQIDVFFVINVPVLSKTSILNVLWNFIFLGFFRNLKFFKNPLFVGIFEILKKILVEAKKFLEEVMLSLDEKIWAKFAMGQESGKIWKIFKFHTRLYILILLRKATLYHENQVKRPFGSRQHCLYLRNPLNDCKE